RLTHRINVDLPEPEGPQMTRRSPRGTSRSMSRSAGKAPYHLLTPCSSTCSMSVYLARPVVGLRRLEPPADGRHRERKQEVDRCREQVDLDAETDPLRIDDDRLGGAEEVHE